ncbi:adenosylcobinamide-GDP ribazoletransferase [uncultured Roseobacter sp.]|uniref:adenosylcobinamide-GDP ribazoletransferase n=1 Tax=uncultured Roseobacter sp. TaxID=114847 RepID=UPI00260C5C56|nr:adenosylcobinamide-GDP ribazoletransferase [uncultured Roseobacter sp.]
MKTDNFPTALTELLVAFTLLTRLPLPHLPEKAFENSARAVWAYPLTGLVTASAGCGLASALFAAGLPVALSAGLGLALATFLTGALHEDGLADLADGFWGAHTPARRLEIMKDSQIGSYGTLVLVFSTGLRWMAWATLLASGPAWIIAAAVLSRAAMPVLMRALPSARSNGLSHSVGRPSGPRVAAGVVVALVICLALAGVPALAAAAAVGVAAWGIAWLARRKIGGQTGDVLGASQQVGEVFALCVLAAAVQ